MEIKGVRSRWRCIRSLRSAEVEINVIVRHRRVLRKGRVWYKTRLISPLPSPPLQPALLLHEVNVVLPPPLPDRL